MPNLLTCQTCQGTGHFMWDGKPAACSCAAGRAWERLHRSGPSWEGTNNLPPGGEVLLRRDAAAAAGVPARALDGVPVRAMLVDDRLMTEALEWVARLASELDPEHPQRQAAAAWVEALPEHYRRIMPVIEATRRRRSARRGSSPMRPS